MQFSISASGAKDGSYSMPSAFLHWLLFFLFGSGGYQIVQRSGVTVNRFSKIIGTDISKISRKISVFTELGIIMLLKGAEKYSLLCPQVLKCNGTYMDPIEISKYLFAEIEPDDSGGYNVHIIEMIRSSQTLRVMVVDIDKSTHWQYSQIYPYLDIVASWILERLRL
ncbi:hypothetical protein JTB14_036565 [Gonioctena quinquepunctata]|nr:hypothetical protein JTB14_036565 [Gonioctena quinquepunctata]